MRATSRAWWPTPLRCCARRCSAPRGSIHTRSATAPLVVRGASLPLGQVLNRLTVWPEKPGDDVDLILVWVAGTRRIITGSDLLGRLLRRIARPAGAITRVKPEA